MTNKGASRRRRPRRKSGCPSRPPRAARRESHHSRTVLPVPQEDVLQRTVQQPGGGRQSSSPDCRPSKLLSLGRKPLGLQARLRFDEVVQEALERTCAGCRYGLGQLRNERRKRNASRCHPVSQLGILLPSWRAPDVVQTTATVGAAGRTSTAQRPPPKELGLSHAGYRWGQRGRAASPEAEHDEDGAAREMRR
ncbi:hypothetical protein HPB48_001657 [Haemaphysalis longicornis]|uniref:Uncharacterized protein n=1 Tax=Haemaphysalis longicornis TaxID=44386 RepID=A0A9J6FBQ8_HAELO|nr:hypothetical protein HPB48_001657 [Haemaphysalis longicornis]